MERRVLLAIFLCFIVLYVWQAVFVKPAPKRPAGATSTSAGTVAAPATAEAAPAPAAAPVEPPAPAAAPLVGEQQEREIRVETDDVTAVFTNRGARLKSWRLKRYQDRNNQPLELIATDLPSNQPLPFSLRTMDEAVDSRVNIALYQVQQRSPNEIAFEYRDNAGLHAAKQFAVGPMPYTVTVRVSVAANDRPLPAAVVWGPGLGDTDSQTGRYAVKPGGIFYSGGKVTRLSASNIAKQSEYDQSFDYAGIDDHYFMSVAMKPGAAKTTYQPLSIPPPPNTKDAA